MPHGRVRRQAAPFMRPATSPSRSRRPPDPRHRDPRVPEVGQVRREPFPLPPRHLEEERPAGRQPSTTVGDQRAVEPEPVLAGAHVGGVGRVGVRLEVGGAGIDGRFANSRSTRPCSSPGRGSSNEPAMNVAGKPGPRGVPRRPADGLWRRISVPTPLARGRAASTGNSCPPQLAPASTTTVARSTGSSAVAAAERESPRDLGRNTAGPGQDRHRRRPCSARPRGRRADRRRTRRHRPGIRRATARASLPSTGACGDAGRADAPCAAASAATTRPARPRPTARTTPHRPGRASRHRAPRSASSLPADRNRSRAASTAATVSAAGGVARRTPGTRSSPRSNARLSRRSDPGGHGAHRRPRWTTIEEPPSKR